MSSLSASGRKLQDELRARAEQLEDDAISCAEARPRHHDWPSEWASRAAHAELKLKAAALLRARADAVGRRPQ